MSNAIKYSDEGTRVELTIRRDGNQAVISVKDAGAGIPPHMLDTIFDMFTQVDRTLEKSQGGLGVGLAIVKRLIEMHGGQVEARSAGYGTGSEFIIRLPLADGAEPDLLADAPHQPAIATGRHRILVVDDNVDGATSLATMLEVAGNDVRTAHDGQQALDTADEFRPDVILLDIGLPRLNGYEVCRRIREQPWGKDLLIVALTGWGQDEDKQLSLEAGFNSHLVKPVEPAVLDQLLAGLAAHAD